MPILIPIVLAYLLGAIPFGLIVARIFGIKDLTSQGSGNIGATNVWRVVGVRAAVWVYLGDITKGVVAVLFARWFFGQVTITWISLDVLLVIVALAAIMGHIFPVYLKFKGGKGVNTALGCMVTLLPIEILISFSVFVIVLLIWRYVSLGSIVGVVCLSTVILVEKYVLTKDVATIYVWLTVALTLLILFTHRRNITRLISGQESRFSFSSRTREAGSSV